jgi:hypothetical protein
VVLGHLDYPQASLRQGFQRLHGRSALTLIGIGNRIVTLAPLCYEYSHNMRKAAVNINRVASRSSSIGLALQA